MDAIVVQPGVSVRRGRDLSRYGADPALMLLASETLFGGADLERDRAAEQGEDANAVLLLGTTRPRPHRRPAAIRAWLEAETAAEGFELDDLVRTVRRGRIAADASPRHDVLAALVRRLRERGVTLQVIGQALGGKNRQTVARLESRGRALLELPPSCRRHAQHKAECPVCIRAVQTGQGGVIWRIGVGGFARKHQRPPEESSSTIPSATKSGR